MILRALLLIAAVTGLAAGGVRGQSPPAGPPPQSAAPQGPGEGHGGDMHAAMDAAKKACQGDMQTLCAGKTGREAMMCMHDNHDKLSPGCKDAMGKMHRPHGFGAWRERMRHRWEDRRAAMEAAKTACQPDMQTLCAGKTGHDAMMCMRDNRDKVSPACKDAVAKVRRHHHWFHRGWFQRGPGGFGPGGPGFGPPSPEQKAAREAAKTACEPDMKALCAGKTGLDAMMCMRENHDKVSQACKDAMAKAHGPRGPAHGADGAPGWRPPPGPSPAAH
jgi:hypothetical protein